MYLFAAGRAVLRQPCQRSRPLPAHVVTCDGTLGALAHYLLYSLTSSAYVLRVLRAAYSRTAISVPPRQAPRGRKLRLGSILRLEGIDVEDLA